MVNINGICYIIAACKENSDKIFLQPESEDIVIAADGGFDILKDKKITPNILLGDFDSLEGSPEHNKVIKYPKEKDETDTFLACKLGIDKEYKNFVIFGGVGGRIDHTLANIQTLLWIAKRGGRAFLIGNDVVMTVISSEKITFSEASTGTISIFAQEQTANGVSINGLKYTAENIALTPEFPLGVSNEFIGKRAEITVENGSLLVVWESKCEDFIKKIGDFVV